jgi:hypothetical protein
MKGARQRCLKLLQIGKQQRAKARKTPEDAGGRLPTLVKNILLSKGATDAQIRTMIKKGIRCRDDFKQVGDAGTLAVLANVSSETAMAIMSWARTAPASGKPDAVSPIDRNGSAGEGPD